MSALFSDEEAALREMMDRLQAIDVYWQGNPDAEVLERMFDSLVEFVSRRAWLKFSMSYEEWYVDTDPKPYKGGKHGNV